MSKSPHLPLPAHLPDGAPSPQPETPQHELSPEAAGPSAGRVLVVDDVAANVRLLSGILKVEGFEVEGASSGAEALEILAEYTPDVVLLDVMMPGMDGLEVCERIRREPATAQLPVVMVTALQGISDRVRALDAGADDFLSKPVDEIEVVARVRSLVRAKRNRDALELAYRDLQAAEQARENLASMLVHDLRTPLTTMLASLGYLQSMLSPGTDAASPAAPASGARQALSHDETLVQMLAICARSGQHLLSLVNQLLDIARLESHEMPLHIEPVDPHAIAEEAVAQACAQSQCDRTRITISVDEATPALHADPDLLRRVLINLLGNAVKFTRRGSEVRVQVLAEPENGGEPQSIRFEVSDEGQGVPLHDQERIFEKFTQAQSRRDGKRASSGLGLFFCKLAVEAHGGRIGVHSQEGQGSTFYFVLPAKPSA